MMKAKIISFRRSRKRCYKNHMIIKVEGIDTKEKAKDLINKKVVWKSPSGKVIEGKISSTHGNKGLLRVIFKKGMPGQALNQSVEVI